MHPKTKLYRLFADDWKATLEEYPEMATRLGVPNGAHRWTDWSFEAIERRKKRRHAVFDALRSIDETKLDARAAFDCELFRRDLEESLAGERYPEELLPIDHSRGVQDTILRLVEMMPRATADDLEKIVARLNAVPCLVNQTVALMRAGLGRRVVPARVAIADVPRQLEHLLSMPETETPMLAAFREPPASIPGARRAKLRQAAEQAYRDCVLPSFRHLAEFFRDEYLPGARRQTSWLELPDGEAWYAHRVKSFTTTELTPRQLHTLGCNVVRRVKEEMKSLIRRTGFRGGFAAFCHFLRTDRRFVHPDAASLLAGYQCLCKRIEPELVRLFGRLPRLPFGVAPVPAHLEQSAPAGFYQPGSLAAWRPGWFYVNTYDLTSRPTWVMEALALHEAVPGHHLQGALAQEAEGLPEFRRHGFHGAYVEGWALYAESLGGELGLLKDPYSKFGQLSLDALRACRLVFDTGLHAFRWPRAKAIDYLMANSCETRQDAVVDIDYAITMPGQVLCYKVGERVIRGLRAEAAGRLGAAFDVRAFHDRVLGEGSLPLEVLQRRVREWVDALQALKRPASATS
ncbi:MAG: DUF885 domain-containing protein [Candidatus Riflebacteria bacterium]|nr:DUF885 domain-containing protein [Candidatus Riflebacteria bacterium]